MKITRINNLLLGVIVLVNAYIIVAPILPGIMFHFESHGGRQQRLQAKLRSQPTGQPNHVIIPSMLLDQPVLEGPLSQNYKVLNQGIWRWPGGSTPDKGSNTILIGHRFTYTDPRGVFYFLNKVSLGDEIGVVWNNKAYTYRVNSIKVVRATDTSIEAGSSQSELTLFTCTPLWLPKNRLVVVADLETNQ